jgi:hypothetical protein
VSTEVVVAQLKRLLREVFELQDQKDETKGQVADIIKQAISTLNVNRKLGKLITATAKSFESEAVKYLFYRSPDVESGESGEEGGWFGLYLGQLEEAESPEFISMPRLDQNILKRNHGAIIHESYDGQVTGSFFPHNEDAIDAWEEAIGETEPELAHP